MLIGEPDQNGMQQRMMMAQMLAKRQMPQGGGWLNGINSGLQNGMRMWMLNKGMQNPGAQGRDPVMGTGYPAQEEDTDYNQALRYLRPQG